MKYLVIFILLISSAFSQVRYEVEIDSMLNNLSMVYCYSQVGLTEKYGDNSDKHVMIYLRSVGIKKPAPYCMAGQYWTFDVAESGQTIPLQKSGVAIHALNYAKKHGKKTKYQAKVGDLIIWKKAYSWQGHIERVIEVGKNGWVKTIGFNTSNGERGDQRLGNGNFIRRRNINYSLGNLKPYAIVGFKSI